MTISNRAQAISTANRLTREHDTQHNAVWDRETKTWLVENAATGAWYDRFGKPLEGVRNSRTANR